MRSPVMQGGVLEAFFIIVPLAPVLLKCSNPALFASWMKDTQRQQASDGVDAILNSRHGNEQGSKSKRGHGLDAGSARSPFLDLGVVGNVITAMLPPPRFV